MNFTIKEIAERAGIAAHVLRYYEKEGLLPAAQRAGNGFRQYTEEDLERLTLICALRESGMSVAEIRDFANAPSRGEQCRILRGQIARTREAAARLQALADSLAGRLEGLEAEERRENAARSASALETEEILAAQAARYPKMRPQDAVKLLYQSEFGGGHIITSPEASLRFLQEEFAKQKPSEGGPVWEPIGGGIARLFLGGLKAEQLPTVNRLFVAGAAGQKGSMERFADKLSLLEAVAAEGRMPFPAEELSDFLAVYRQNGCPMVSHSPAYREAYHPAYRILPERYLQLLGLFLEIDGRIAEQGRLVLAIDGRCGAGKSTLASLIAGVYDAAVVHMDDFFLPPAMRTEERLAEPGGNFDRERFLSEVGAGLRSGKSFSYRVFDCSKMELGEYRAVPERELTIVEGSYSQHPELLDLYGLRVFATCPPEVQKRRIFERSGAALYPRFVREWIPMEERYFAAFAVAEGCGWVLDSSIQPGCFVRKP